MKRSICILMFHEEKLDKTLLGICDSIMKSVYISHSITGHRLKSYFSCENEKHQRNDSIMKGEKSTLGIGNFLS